MTNNSELNGLDIAQLTKEFVQEMKARNEEIESVRAGLNSDFMLTDKALTEATSEIESPVLEE